jgi:hypothetical protein
MLISKHLITTQLIAVISNMIPRWPLLEAYKVTRLLAAGHDINGVTGVVLEMVCTWSMESLLSHVP